MHRSYLSVVLVFIHFVWLVYGQVYNKIDCPNYSYRCPDCKDGQFCAYPSGYGCEGNVGVPVCQSACRGIVCGSKALPCPDKCPFACEYHGPACCPFLGEPTCLPPCNTLRPCDETPCPDNCPHDCFYPNADICCPKSGKPVCRSELRNNYQHDKLLKRAEYVPEQPSPVSLVPNLTGTEKDDHAICVDMIIPCPPECRNDCEYPTDVPCPRTHPPKCRSTTNEDHIDDTVPKEFDKLMNELTDMLVKERKLTAQLEQFLEHGQDWIQWIHTKVSNKTDYPVTASL